LKILVIGYGSIGKRHIKNLLTIKNIEIILCTKQIISNPNQKRIKVVNSINKGLKEKPDIAIIANVSNLHIKTAIKLAKDKMDLFIEKPLSNSSKNIQELKKIIDKNKIITQIGCQMRFHKCINKINQLIIKKKLGKIISAKVECGSFLPDWHPYEKYTDSYASKKNQGGVVLTCIHEIDYLYWFFGKALEVISMTGKYSNLRISADDLSAGIIRFKNNVVAELHLDYFQKPSFRSCKIIGTKGTIYWDSDSNIVKFYDIKKERWVKILKISNYDRNSMYKEEMIHFLNCVKERKKTINPVEIDGENTLKIGLAIIKSSKLKKMVKV
jgi:predicted dehydrogenase